MLRTFFLVCISLVLFRSADLAMSVDYYAEIFSFSIFTPPTNFPVDITLLVVAFMAAEWFNREREHTFEFKIKPFMPTVFGDGKIAQFTTHSYPSIGFYLLLAIGFLSLLAILAKSKAMKETGSN